MFVADDGADVRMVEGRLRRAEKSVSFRIFQRGETLTRRGGGVNQALVGGPVDDTAWSIG